MDTGRVMGSALRSAVWKVQGAQLARQLHAGHEEVHAEDEQVEDAVMAAVTAQGSGTWRGCDGAPRGFAVMTCALSRPSTAPALPRAPAPCPELWHEMYCRLCSNEIAEFKESCQ